MPVLGSETTAAREHAGETDPQQDRVGMQARNAEGPRSQRCAEGQVLRGKSNTKQEK